MIVTGIEAYIQRNFPTLESVNLDLTRFVLNFRRKGTHKVCHIHPSETYPIYILSEKRCEIYSTSQNSMINRNRQIHLNSNASRDF